MPYGLKEQNDNFRQAASGRHSGRIIAKKLAVGNRPKRGTAPGALMVPLGTGRQAPLLGAPL